MSTREEYLKLGWKKCGMEMIDDPVFQATAVEEVRKKNLLTETAQNREAELAASKAEEENETFKPDCEEDEDLTAAEVSLPIPLPH
jgi:hypothetical protein